MKAIFLGAIIQSAIILEGGAIVGEQLSGAQLSCSHHSLQRNLCGILKFTERPKTPGIIFLKK